MSDRLFALLDELNIEVTTLEHEATFTVDESRQIKAEMPGGHSKNLFLKDKAGTLILISAHTDTQIQLNQLHKRIGTKRLSFGKAELLEEVLGVRPGSVTAFALINDPDQHVRFILDKALADHDTLCFHPLRNTATTAIRRADFDRFIEATGRTLDILDFSASGPTDG